MKKTLQDIAQELVALRILMNHGTNLWVYLDPPEVVCYGSQETPRIPDDVRAIYAGRSTGPGNTDTGFWLDGLCHIDDDGIYRYDESNEIVGNGSLEDALEQALDVGHYPELVDNEYEELVRIMKEAAEEAAELARESFDDDGSVGAHDAREIAAADAYADTMARFLGPDWDRDSSR